MNTYISRQGFTIVELLIVIVVVAVLAAVSVSALNGTQQRARDTQRVHDMQTIVKALELYKIQTGTYPPVHPTNQISGWEVSSINPGQFLSALKTSGVVSSVPVDPINNGTTVHGMLYRYTLYPAGSNGCLSSRGAFYVLAVGDVETSAGSLDSSPGFSCSFPWSGGWVTGGFVKG
ncbi:prepilin-type N-terminal cleavage/methylation domain-containing protein [Streptomyces caniscabiei]|uniref:prepilin-type N-terminal cleavage/methylation domain-containing protein n=1 Tax=Streptomyces caniscabiei TaxID=2746961 RepID=UPI0029BF0798|nr:prepilin-type N-terminal cleavage/methylation domain-containing protein [Streptomyces caniscabiei]MDX2776131.1 prepilin-type N-terminal cleavage/methylation domain-containing protein [Streptomyces caniscabiei]